MCGITCALSKNNDNISLFILQSLLLLQNRGYDSAGVMGFSYNNKVNINKDTITKEIVNISSNKIMSSEIKVLSNASPSLEEIKYLISTWLTNKSSYLAGKSELNISKIVRDGLIRRTIQQRESDLKKGIYKEINSILY